MRERIASLALRDRCAFNHRGAVGKLDLQSRLQHGGRYHLPMTDPAAWQMPLAAARAAQLRMLQPRSYVAALVAAADRRDAIGAPRSAQSGGAA